MLRFYVSLETVQLCIGHVHEDGSPRSARREAQSPFVIGTSQCACFMLKGGDTSPSAEVILFSSQKYVYYVVISLRPQTYFSRLLLSSDVFVCWACLIFLLN